MFKNYKKELRYNNCWNLIPANFHPNVLYSCSKVNFIDVKNMHINGRVCNLTKIGKDISHSLLRNI